METFLGLPCPPLPTLPARRPDSHKGDFGHALIIGGSRGMTGAISLTGLAALHCGAGLVTLAIPDRCSNRWRAFALLDDNSAVRR